MIFHSIHCYLKKRIEKSTIMQVSRISIGPCRPSIIRVRPSQQNQKNKYTKPTFISVCLSKTFHICFI